MITDLKPTTTTTTIDKSVGRWYGTLADDARVRRTTAALEANRIRVLRAPDAAAAKRLVLDLIPEGAQVHHGASLSLEVSGITAEIEQSGRYQPPVPRSGAWTARPRATRSAASRPRPT